MKLIANCCLIFLLLSVLNPKEIEAGAFDIIDPISFSKIIQLAATQGLKVAIGLHYAKCKSENVPAGTKCQKNVYGIGNTAKQATSTAKIYANMFGGSPQCKQFVNVAGCKIYKFTKQQLMM